MIYSFGGRNFFSFRDEFQVDFRVPPKASARGVFLTDSQNTCVNRVVGVFGANACGKTNLLKALGYLQWFILHSASATKPNESLNPTFFRFEEDPDLVTVLWIEFNAGNQFYRYEVALEAAGVVCESLHKRVDRLNYVFQRTWNASKEKFDLKAQHEFEDVSPALAQRRNASLISTALLVDFKGAIQLCDFFNSFYGNLSHFGRTHTHDPDVVNLIATAEFFKDEPEHLDWVNKRLAHFDLGLQAIRIDNRKFIDENGSEGDAALPIGLHHFNGIDYGLSLFSESRGTQALFVLLRHILPVLRNGGVAYVDEFELGLHSHMIPRILDLFYASKHNRRGAQLIFSTQADYVIQRLEKCQIRLVNKSDDGVSDVYSLDDIRGVRADENHYSKYHAGAYGGVPRI